MNKNHPLNKELLAQEKKISTEIYTLSKKFESEGIKDYHNKARAEINKKYGKGWRETLHSKMLYDNEDFANMSYY